MKEGGTTSGVTASPWGLGLSSPPPVPSGVDTRTAPQEELGELLTEHVVEESEPQLRQQPLHPLLQQEPLRLLEEDPPVEPLLDVALPEPVHHLERRDVPEPVPVVRVRQRPAVDEETPAVASW